MEFLKAVFMGIAIAAPVGPIGVLCIKKALESGFKTAFYVGIGAALADGLYGGIAAFGIDALMKTLLDKAYLIQFFGGVFLIYLAYQEVRKKEGKTLQVSANKNLIIQVFFLTLANPLTIMTFVGVFASLASTSLHPFAMFLAVFLGSLVWWIILGGGVSMIRHKLPNAFMKGISYASAFILGAFGLSSVISSISKTWA